MPRLALNKGALQRESRRLRVYRRLLPVLDLKKRQLIAEHRAAVGELQRKREAIRQAQSRVAETLPMLANRRVDLQGLVRVVATQIGEGQRLGVRIPTLEAVETRRAEYGLLVRPHWVDSAATAVEATVRLRLEVRVQAEVARRLSAAATKVTQRVNLFEKVLIPQAEARIRRIRIHLADAERAAVVRAKIAKRKQAEGMRS